MDIRELRLLMEAHDGSIPLIECVETIEDYALDESFLGKRPVKSVNDAMEAIEKLVLANPQVNVNNTKEGKALEAAISTVFGFRSTNIFWANRPGLGRGPYTLVGCKTLHMGSSSFQYGAGAKGFYDANHELSAYIEMDQNLFTMCGCTAAEATAILLHEIGHNFDHSIYSVIDEWYRIISILTDPQKDWTAKLTNAAVGIVVPEFGKGAIQLYMNVDEHIANAVSPLGTIIRGVGKVMFNLNKLLNALFAPASIIITIPVMFVMSPLYWLSNFFTRKKEMYADSFAASYGYGSELITGLNKLEMYMTGDPDDTSMMHLFYDLAMAQRDIVGMCTGGHTSTQQRMIKTLGKLESDLAKSKYDPALKKELKKNLDDCRKTYNNYIGMTPDARQTTTAKLRQLVDGWYGGKSYIIIPTDEYERAE